jgi:hypothetical protein
MKLYPGLFGLCSAHLSPALPPVLPLRFVILDKEKVEFNLYARAEMPGVSRIVRPSRGVPQGLFR